MFVVEAAFERIWSVSQSFPPNSAIFNYFSTLESLFSCGFEPNERIEKVVGTFPEVEELESYVGYAPIQIVAASALDILHKREVIGEAVYSNISKFITNVVVFFVQNGARLSLDAPPMMRSGENRQSSQSSMSEGSATASDAGNEQAVMKRADLKIQGNKALMSLFGTPEVTEAQKSWKEMKPVPASSRSIFFTDKMAIDNSSAPGGSDDKSCAICWKAFGMLVRKHRCRVSRRFVCDECSTKRILGNGEEHRISDGQFLLSKIEAANKMKTTTPAVQGQQPTAQQKPYIGTAARLDRLEAQENENRDSLFGGIVASVTNALGGTEDQDATQMSQADSISGLSSQLNQTRDALNERGDKLSSLADKSDKLVNAASDFEAMAKELNRKTNQGFFSW